MRWLALVLALWTANAVVVGVEVYVDPGLVRPLLAAWSGGILTTLLLWRLYVVLLGRG